MTNLQMNPAHAGNPFYRGNVGRLEIWESTRNFFTLWLDQSRYMNWCFDSLDVAAYNAHQVIFTGDLYSLVNGKTVQVMTVDTDNDSISVWDFQTGTIVSWSLLELAYAIVENCTPQQFDQSPTPSNAPTKVTQTHLERFLRIEAAAKTYVKNLQAHDQPKNWEEERNRLAFSLTQAVHS